MKMMMKSTATALFLNAALLVSAVSAQITPPSPTDKAATARWMVHNNKWGTFSTINSRERLGAPFGNIASFSDGAPNESTGTLYFLHSNLDSSMKDVMVDDSVSFTLSEAQMGYCQQMEYDMEDPRCARLNLSGKLVELSDKMEIEEAKKAVFSKHPSMEEWYGMGDDDPSGHDFHFWKMELEEIWLVDFFGGAAHVGTEAWNRGTDTEGESKIPESVVQLLSASSSSAAQSGTGEASSSPLSMISIVLIVASAFVAYFVGRKSGYRRASLLHSAVQNSVALDPTEFMD